VKHADDITVTFSECDTNATVRTHEGIAAPTYELTNYLRDHGCCSCVEGTQDDFCMHHLLVLCAKFNQLTRDAVVTMRLSWSGLAWVHQKDVNLEKRALFHL
jgi:hypothetical protein